MGDNKMEINLSYKFDYRERIADSNKGFRLV